MTVSNVFSQSSLFGVDQIRFTTDQGAPTINTRSEGVKLVLLDTLASGQPGACIGMESGFMYFTMPQPTTGFKFYGNTTAGITIMGNGNITTAG